MLLQTYNSISLIVLLSLDIFAYVWELWHFLFSEVCLYSFTYFSIGCWHFSFSFVGYLYISEISLCHTCCKFCHANFKVFFSTICHFWLKFYLAQGVLCHGTISYFHKKKCKLNVIMFFYWWPLGFMWCLKEKRLPDPRLVF